MLCFFSMKVTAPAKFKDNFSFQITLNLNFDTNGYRQTCEKFMFYYNKSFLSL